MDCSMAIGQSLTTTAPHESPSIHPSSFYMNTHDSPSTTSETPTPSGPSSSVDFRAELAALVAAYDNHRKWTINAVFEGLRQAVEHARATLLLSEVE